MAGNLILLIEDNEDDRFLAVRQLRRLPGAVAIEIARSGDEALARIAASTGESLPKLVLLDLQLPKVDGITVLQAIRARYRQEELPVVVLSSSDNPRDLAVCEQLGISGYLAKPLEIADLQEILATILPVSSPTLR